MAQLERPPILVVGDVHTGASWIAEILSAHPQVAGLSELRLFSGIGLEPPFRDSHWNPESSERMFDRRMGFGQFLTRERVVKDLRTLSDRWLARALLPEHRFLVERSPAGAPGARAFASLYPDGLLIYALRDGRDVARSAFLERDRQLRTAKDEAARPPEPWRLLWSMGRSWSAHVKGLRELVTSTPMAHQVRYEDLLARPRDSARTLFGLCSIPCNEEQLEQILAQIGPPPRTPSGGWNRLERALYGAGAGERLHQLGYAPAPAPGVRLLREGLLGYERVKRVI